MGRRPLSLVQNIIALHIWKIKAIAINSIKKLFFSPKIHIYQTCAAVRNNNMIEVLT